MSNKRISRRDFFRGASMVLLAGGSSVLASCAQPTAQVIEKTIKETVPVTVKETVVVQGTSQITEKVVEKVVTPSVAPITLKQVTLQFAQPAQEGFDDKTYGTFLKEWQKRLKGVYPTLDFEPVTVDYQKQAMAMAAGNAADVAFINVPSAWPLIYRKQLLDLQPALDADKEWAEYLTHFVPTTLNTYTYKAHLFCIPTSVETTGTIYNEDLLKAAGVKLPHEYKEAEWDWNAYIQTAKSATKGDGADKIWGAFMNPDVQGGLGDMVYSNGGGWLTDDGLGSRVTEPAFAEAAEVAIGMVTKDKVSPSTANLSDYQNNAYAALINQKLTLMISGDWAFGWVLNNLLPDKKFKLNFFTSPVSPKSKKSVGVGHSTGIYAWTGGKNINEALAFLKFAASQPGQSLWSENWTKSPVLSPRLDAQDAFWKLNLVPNPDAMKRAFEVSMPYPHTPLMNASIAIGYVNTGIGAAMNGDDTRPVKDILAEIDKKIVADLQKSAGG